MKNSSNYAHFFRTEHFKDEKYHQAVKEFPPGVLVYITATNQVQAAEEVRATPDGPRIKVHDIGSVPVEELRIATDRDIEESKFKDGVQKIDNHYFFKP